MKFNIRTKTNETLTKKELSNLISDVYNFQHIVLDKYNIKLETNIKIEVKNGK